MQRADTKPKPNEKRDDVFTNRNMLVSESAHVASGTVNEMPAILLYLDGVGLPHGKIVGHILTPEEARRMAEGLVEAARDVEMQIN